MIRNLTGGGNMRHGVSALLAAAALALAPAACGDDDESGEAAQSSVDLVNSGQITT
jgi:hypothetical protein